jgi:hypothetical protein
MRCKCCDILLNDYELSLVDTMTDEPLDTCEVCLGAAEDTGGYDIDVEYYDIQ